METKLVHITSAKGPSECCLAVALTLKEMLAEARAHSLACEATSRVKGEINGTLCSATVKLEGANVSTFLQTWQGVLLWVVQSPHRKFHKRKNWFIGIHEVLSINTKPLRDEEITFQTMRSSGPGGQNVNKTETAVRAIHKSSGIFATCNTYKSQLQNKHEAIKRLKEKHMEWQKSQMCEQNLNTEWENNTLLSRGNPKRTYMGENFKRKN